MHMFLNAKHWQLFLVMFGLPFLLQMLLIGNVIVQAQSGQNPIDFTFIRFFPLLMLLFAGLLFGWIWSVAMGLQSKLPATVSMNITLFKTFFFIPLVYMICLLGFIVLNFGGILKDGAQTNFSVIWAVIFIIPMHLFAMFCIFYCMYFTAKTLKSAELQRPAKFSDYSAEFFMIWFYPIGVWLIQPIINKVAKPGYQPPQFPHY